MKNLKYFALISIIIFGGYSLNVPTAHGANTISFRYMNIDDTAYSGVSSAATWMSFREIEVYDANGNKYTPAGATVSNDWVNTQWGGYGKASTYDGNIYTAWNAGSYGGWYTLDLGSVKSVSKIRLLPAVSPNPAMIYYDVKVSSDGQNYTIINTFSPMIADNVWLECTFNGTTPVCNGNSSNGGGTGGGTGGGGTGGGGSGGTGGVTIIQSNTPSAYVTNLMNILNNMIKTAKNALNNISGGYVYTYSGDTGGTGGGGGGGGSTGAYVWSADQCTEALAQGAWSSGAYSQDQVRRMAKGEIISVNNILISLNRAAWTDVSTCIASQLKSSSNTFDRTFATLADLMATFPLR